MSSRDERLARTQEVIRSLLTDMEPRNITVIFGAAYCHRPSLVSGEKGLSVAVGSDWLEAVHAEGIAVVDGKLVVSAQICPAPEPAEACWLAQIALEQYEPNVPSRSMRRDWQWVLKLVYIVRHGGVVRSGIDPKAALERCFWAHEDALGVQHRSEWAERLNSAIPAYLQQIAEENKQARERMKKRLGGSP